MPENPISPKLIEREDKDTRVVSFDGSKGKVEYHTGKWDPVAGGRGVTCRTWRLEGGDDGADGADIIIENGWTPIQRVKAANVVVDAPEEGEGSCCVMDLEGKIHVTPFDSKNKGQMVWSEGMIITWVSKTRLRFTEFEAPSYSDGMFENIPDDSVEFQSLPMAKYLRKVTELRALVGVEK